MKKRIQNNFVNVKCFSFFIFLGTFNKIEAINFREEPTYSYGIKIGAGYEAYPMINNDFIKIHPQCTKAGEMSFGGMFFFEKRFFRDTFGLNLDLGFKRRSFSHHDEITKESAKININSIDLSIIFCLLPTGYGGFNIYFGGRGYYMVNTSTKINDSESEKKIYDLEKFNLAGVLGFSYEVDRTGLILGFEGEHFFLNLMKNFKPSNLKGFFIYIGYDFARLGYK